MFVSRAFGIGVLAVVHSALAQGDATKDLGSVLASIKNLTSFYDLIKKYPEVSLQLPGLDGVTVSPDTMVWHATVQGLQHAASEHIKVG
jgi:transforming growth factor-beta-induced protein